MPSPPSSFPGADTPAKLSFSELLGHLLRAPHALEPLQNGLCPLLVVVYTLPALFPYLKL